MELNFHKNSKVIDVLFIAMGNHYVNVSELINEISSRQQTRLIAKYFQTAALQFKAQKDTKLKLFSP